MAFARRSRGWLALALIAVGAAEAVLAAPEPLVQNRLGRTLPGQVKALAAGKLLVAARDLGDPNFAETVVLLFEYNPKGAAGLVVNVRADVPLSSVFGQLNLGVNATRPAFVGGPVSRTSALALLRGPAKATGTRLVATGIHLITTREALEDTLAADASPNRCRVYLGYAGWGTGQLERETETGAWHVFDAEPDLVFDTDPATVWRRLIRRTEFLQARAGLAW